MRRTARHAGCRFTPRFAAALALGLAAPTFAGMIEGDGKGKAANDCMVELSIDATPTPTGPAITCSDCDGTCDADATQDDQCSFAVKLCVNQTGDSACTPTALKKAFANVKGVHGLKKLAAPASPGGRGCGAGQVCTDACTCSSATACACGTPDPTMLKFTSAIGSGTCG